MTNQPRRAPTVVDSGGHSPALSLSMSVQTTRPDEDTCAFPDCDAAFSVPNAVRGSYCSQDCADRHDGRRLLRHLRQDHRVCSSCFRLKKDVEVPSEIFEQEHFDRTGSGWTRDDDGRVTLEFYGQDTAREAVVGIQHHTEHASMGPHGLECECGAVDHDSESDLLRSREAWHWWLAVTTRLHRAEGQRDDAVDPVTLADVYWATDDLELAAGRALS